jgi:RHS repeat-associated protein
LGNRQDSSGLVLMGHRCYDPSLGWFLNRDPIGYGGGLNLYAYCYGDPINMVDPTGFGGWYDPYAWGVSIGAFADGLPSLPTGPGMSFMDPKSQIG